MVDLIIHAEKTTVMVACTVLTVVVLIVNSRDRQKRTYISVKLSYWVQLFGYLNLRTDDRLLTCFLARPQSMFLAQVGVG
jgi:hypothetical protein